MDASFKSNKRKPKNGILAFDNSIDDSTYYFLCWGYIFEIKDEVARVNNYKIPYPKPNEFYFELKNIAIEKDVDGNNIVKEIGKPVELDDKEVEKNQNYGRLELIDVKKELSKKISNIKTNERKPRVLDDEERQMNNYLISQGYYYADSAKEYRSNPMNPPPKKGNPRYKPVIVINGVNYTRNESSKENE